MNKCGEIPVESDQQLFESPYTPSALAAAASFGDKSPEPVVTVPLEGEKLVKTEYTTSTTTTPVRTAGQVRILKS